MAASTDRKGPVYISGNSEALVESLEKPLRGVLEGRHHLYLVEIADLGPVGEVLVSITASRGRLPLLFGRGELRPERLARVVEDALDAAAL
jgi:hypothetical protein